MTQLALRGLTAFASVLTLAIAQPALADPMTAEDLATLDRVGSTAVSPDETMLVYSLTTTELDPYARPTGLYALDLNAPDAAPVRIADQDGHSEHSPEFSADGRYLYYLTGASGSEQVWRMAVRDGSQEQVTFAATDISGFDLSPAGGDLAVWAMVAADCDLAGCPEDDGENPAEEPIGNARSYDQLFVRHWDTWEEPGTLSTLFVYNLDADGLVTGEARDLSRLANGDTPTQPFGGGEEIAWTADGSAILFTARTADADEPQSTNTDIYVADPDGEEPLVNLTAANLATDTLPAPSPDGRWLAWAAMARPGYESDRLVVQLLHVDTGELTALTEDWDRSVGSIAWTAGSDALIVTAQDTLNHPAYRVDIASGEVTRLTERGNISGTVPLSDGGMIYAINAVTAPTDLVRWMADGQTQRLTNVNSEQLAAIDPVQYETFSFTGANGDTVWGQIIKPISDADQLPLAFVVHGGPQGSFGNSWSTRWNPMVMASQGYAVVTIDFHGSTGYGQDFTDSINRDWGGAPLVDLQMGMAALADIDAQIDTDNACALGASYGGFMMNWIAGNWPEQFRCIVNHDGLFDMRSFYYSTEELWFPEWDFGGPYYEVAENYERWNPANHVANWQTPMLVIQGERDFRVPTEQSLAAFTALQRQDIPSRLLVFPTENHWVLNGANSVRWHNEVFSWLDRWLRPDETETAEAETAEAE